MSIQVLYNSLESYKLSLQNQISVLDRKIFSIDELLKDLSKEIENTKVVQVQPALINSGLSDAEAKKIYDYVSPQSPSSKRSYSKKDLNNDKELIISCVSDIINKHSNEELTSLKLCKYLESEHLVAINAGDAHPSQVLAQFLKNSLVIKAKEYRIMNHRKSIPVKLYYL